MDLQTNITSKIRNYFIEENQRKQHSTVLEVTDTIGINTELNNQILNLTEENEALKTKILILEVDLNTSSLLQQNVKNDLKYTIKDLAHTVTQLDSYVNYFIKQSSKHECEILSNQKKHLVHRLEFIKTQTENLTKRILDETE